MEANKILNLLFELRDNTHVAHLQTKNYNDHKVLNKFYDGILCLADEFAEQYQGFTGTIITNIGSLTLREGVQVDSYLKEARGVFTDKLEECNIPSIKPIFENIIALINSTLYLLNLD